MAMFRSLDDAMRWAFRYRIPAYPRSQLARAMQHKLTPENLQEARSLDPDLEPLPNGDDGAAQVSMLQSFVARQSEPGRSHLLAKYSHGQSRTDAIRELRTRILPVLDTAIRPRYMVYELARRFYGARVMFKDLAGRILYVIEERPNESPESRARRAWRAVRNLSRDVDDKLQTISMHAEEVAYAELQRQGVIL